MNKAYFKKGEYVVLLASCDGMNCWSSIPINHVYRLAEDCFNFKFYVEKNIKGSWDGWSLSRRHHHRMDRGFF